MKCDVIVCILRTPILILNLARNLPLHKVRVMNTSYVPVMSAEKQTFRFLQVITYLMSREFKRLKCSFFKIKACYPPMFEFKKLIDRSGSGIEDEGGEFDADDLDFMKELGKKDSDSSEEESDPNEDPRAKRKRLRVKMMVSRDSDDDDDDDDDDENDSYDEEEEPEEVYNVDKILGTKGKGKKMRVHVLWEAGDKTWEPLANVQETEAWEFYLKSQKEDEGDSEATEPED